MHAPTDHRWGIVLAAGEGMRLQEFLRSHFGREIPKQFSTVIGTRSLLRHTLDRVEILLKARQVLTVVAKEHLPHVHGLLTRAEEHASVAVPANRETAPNVLLPALMIQHADPDASVAVFPSDHFVLEERRFMEYVEHALEFAEVHPDLVVLLGVQPDRPDPDYGWIELRHEFDHHGGNRFYHVAGFHEKPAPEEAARMFAHGGVWNTMVIAAKAATLIGLYRKGAPELLRTLEHLAPSLGAPDIGQKLDQVYPLLPPMNFSKHILERHASRLRILRLDGVHWSDWGVPGRILATFDLLGGGVP